MTAGQFRVAGIAVAFVAALACCAQASAAEGILIRLEDRNHQAEYVTREPIKLVVTLVNNSNEQIRIPGWEYFGSDWDCIYLEIVGPDGAQQCRRFQFWDSYGIINEKYLGEPLLPGDYREIRLYPNVTFQVDCRSLAEVSRMGATFGEPGDYRVRAVYQVPNYWPALWRPSTQLVSNEVTLRFREPDAEEREIIDAIWSGDGSDLSLGDDAGGRMDEGFLREVIAKYPRNRLEGYAEIALARTLYLTPDGSCDSEALSWVEKILTAHPGLRPEEVLSLGAKIFLRMQEPGKAAALADSALKLSPGLIDDSDFMALKVHCDGGDNGTFNELERARFKATKPDPIKPRKE